MPERVATRKIIGTGERGVFKGRLSYHAPLRYFGILMLVAMAVAVIAISPASPATETAEAQTVSVCDRTPQVRDAILRAVVEGASCTSATGFLGSVRSLNMRNTGIKEFKANDFQDMGNLTSLDIGENHISALPDDFWDFVTSLNRLHMYNNKFTALDDDFFKKSDGTLIDKSNLRSINASGNEIASIGGETLKGFPNLRDIDLSHNKLTTLPANFIDGTYELINLDLSNNELTSVPNDFLSRLTENGNGCRPGAAPHEANSNRTLERVELQRNNLTSLPDGVFQCLITLLHVDLSHNSLETLPDNIFRYNLIMITADVSFNQLTTLPGGFVKRQKRLEILDLSNNQLTSFDSAEMHESGARGIRELDISNNQLTQLPDRYVTAFLDRAGESNGFCLLNLDMSNNPFSAEWIQSGKLNDFLTQFGQYNPRGPAHNDDETECRSTTRWPYYQDTFNGRPLFGESGLIGAARFNIFEAIAISDTTDVETLGLAGIDLSHIVTDEGKSSWQLLLDQFDREDAYERLYDFSFGWEGLSIDNDMLDDLPLQLERIEVKDARFADNISDRAGRGFNRFDGVGKNDVYDYIDNVATKTGIRTLDDIDQLRPGSLYFAQLPIDTYTGFKSWFTDRGENLQSLVLDNVGLTGDGGVVLDRLPESSMRWLEIRNNPGLTEINENIKAMSNLYGLQIENTGISSIPAGTFNSLSKLTYLGLPNNKIATVEGGAFETLSDVEVLLLNDNEIGGLSSGTLDGMQRLENLNLQNNDIAGIPSAFFAAVDRAAASQNDDGTERRVFGEYVFPMEQLILDGNPGAPFHINVVSGEVENSEQRTIDVREGAPYRFEIDILRTNMRVDQTLWIDDGTLISDPFDLPMGGSGGVRFLDMHPNRPSGDNRDCLGHSVCYSGFEFKVDPPARLIDIKLSSPPQHYGVGEKINFQARYSEEVVVTGSPTLSFTIANPPDKTATFVGPLSTAPHILEFEYTVDESDVGRTGVDTRNSMLMLSDSITVVGADGDTIINTVQVPVKSSVSGIAFVPAGQGTSDTGPDGTRLSTALIKRIEPSIRSVSLRSGEVVRLAIDAYGRQNALDNDLLDDATIEWDDNNAGGDIDGSGSRITYTAPSAPGVYTITASLAERDCRDDAETEESECSATFQVTVRRASVPQPEEVAPVNPSGVIPTILTDNRGNNYEVFTPVGGGSFDAGEGFSITAAAGDVPNGEIIGVRMSEGGTASNLGMTHQRYTLGGNRYSIEVVDSAGASVDAYVLDQPAEVCIPLPAALSANISKIAMAALNSDGTLTILSATARIGGSSPSICGNVSTLPATVAAGVQGAPDDIPTPVPPPEPETPDTGATAPSNQGALWAMLVGIAIATLAVGVLFAARRRKQNN